MTREERVAAAATALVGVRFRLHGRDPATGLDCIGLAARAFAAAGDTAPVPTGYPMRGGRTDEIVAIIDRRLVRIDGPEPGALLLAAPGPGQFHAAIAVTGGVVHADAGLRRVVLRPGVPPWPLIACWRARHRED